VNCHVDVGPTQTIRVFISVGKIVAAFSWSEIQILDHEGELRVLNKSSKKELNNATSPARFSFFPDDLAVGVFHSDRPDRFAGEDEGAKAGKVTLFGDQPLQLDR
jgi:hypothetical protein